MRHRLSLVAWGWLAACGSEGQLDVEVRWSVPPELRPAPGSVWVHAAVLLPDGQRQASTPVRFGTDAPIPLERVPFGPGLRVEVRLLETDRPDSDPCCVGVSEPFDFEEGRQVDVVVDMDLQPVLRVDQNRVSWIRAPGGRQTPQSLGDFVLPAGPYFGVAPAEGPNSPAAVVDGAAFRLVGDIVPPSLQFVSGDEGAGLRVLATVAPDPAGDWPRARMGLGAVDPESVSVRAVAGTVVSDPVPLVNVWYVATTSADDPNVSIGRVEESPGEPASAVGPIERDRTGAPDGSAVEIVPELVWRRVGRPPALSGSVMAYDSDRRRMVMFGGQRASGIQSQETWERVGTRWVEAQPSIRPPPRIWASMAYDPSRRRMVLFGGLGVEILDDTWEWDGLEWTEVAVQAKPPPLAAAAMAFDPGTGELVMFGDADSDDTWTFDGAAWTRLEGVDGPGGRNWPTMAYDPIRQRLLLYGGTIERFWQGDTWAFDGRGWERLDIPEFIAAEPDLFFDPNLQRMVLFEGTTSNIYVLEEGGWSLRNPEPFPPARRIDPVVAYDLERGVAVLTGGETPSRRFYDDVWEWDGAGWTDVTPPDGPSASTFGQITYDRARRVAVYWDGRELWELDASRWSRANPLFYPGPRRFAPLAYDERASEVLMFGGTDDALRRYGGMWAYDGRLWYEPTSPFRLGIPLARYAHGMVHSQAAGVTLLFGGLAGPGDAYGDTWTWDGTEWTEQQTTLSPSPRAFPSMAYDRDRGEVLLFGGFAPDVGVDGQTWRWTGSDGWFPLTTSTVPPARGGAGMAYDERRQVMVMFGGGVDNVDGQLVGIRDTWEFDGDEWNRIETPNRPPASYYPSLIYDLNREVVLLFGTPEAQTAGGSGLWAYDGNDWTQLIPSLRPSPRDGSAAAYDPVRDEVLFFGGSTNDFAGTSDTWVLNDGTWRPVDTSDLPLQRYEAAMGWDPVSERIILFGGFDPSAFPLGDTWAFENGDWVRLAPATQPTGRGGHRMVTVPDFDGEGRGRLVMFGGLARAEALEAPRVLADTWVWNGTDWEAGPGEGPVARYRHGLAADVRPGQAVLFGGRTSVEELSDTWILSREGWQRAAPAVSPEGRFGHRMVLDQARGKAVLVGGTTIERSLSDAVWEWDGANWTPLSTPRGLESIQGPGLVATADGLVLFGGRRDSADTQLGEAVTDDLWTAGAERRESLQIQVELGSGIERSDIRELDVEFSCLSTASGTLLVAWDGQAWRELGRSDAVEYTDRATMAAELSADETAELIRDRGLTFQCRSAGSGGRPSLSLDYGEVRIRYQVGL